MEPSTMDPIAIIGLGFKLPQGAEDYASFWDILEAGRNVKTDWPKTRTNIDAFHNANINRPYTLQARGAHFIKDDPSLFDAPFFSITAKEAAAMDPQQRLLMETTYLALENAGIPVSRIARSQTAVFEASMLDDYNRFVCKDPDTMPQMTVTGTAHSIMANRISWFFNLLGPSIHVDTACSSSMVAVDLACQSLQNQTCSTALVTGSNLILSPEGSIMLSRMNFLSPDSLSYSFDHRANGYGRGEGNIVIVLKRLSDAIKDGDMIRAIIRSTGSNQDGHTPGITQPSGSSQESLIRSVYAKAGLGFESTRYVEAHGTGTTIGDPIELSAVGRVFRTSRSSKDPLYIGSVKANIGHLEGASGLAGIVKAVLMLEQAVIPPNALFEKINPALDVEFYHIEIPTMCKPWPGSGIRRISVNSFGFGGSNSHAILDDALSYLRLNGLAANHCTIPANNSDHIVNGHMQNYAYDMPMYADAAPVENGVSTPVDTDGRQEDGRVRPIIASDSPQPLTSGGETEESDLPMTNGCRLLVWSAFDKNSLTRMMEAYMFYYQRNISGNVSKADKLAFTLSVRRTLMLWRSFAVITPNGNTDLAISRPTRSSNRTGIAFVFTGQGAQYVDMGMELLGYPVFRETLVRIDGIFASIGSKWSLFDEMKRTQNINKPEYSQPLCTALQIALVELFKSLNLTPIAVTGHSSGEIAAAYTIGALELYSACKVAFYRGLLAGRLAASTAVAGAMLSANLQKDDVPIYLARSFPDPKARPDVTVACVNSPLNVTLSGDERSIDILEARLRQDNIFAQKVKTGVAYHSAAMEAVADDYLELMGTLASGSSRQHALMISSVTGKVIERQLVSQPEYWASNLVSPVQFNDALSSVLSLTSRLKLGQERSKPVYDLIEIGPHAALRRPCMDILGATQRAKDVRYTCTLQRSRSPLLSILNLIGTLFSYGYDVSVANVNTQLRLTDKHCSNFLVDTPQYSFNHSQRYWHESRISYDWRMQDPVPREVLGSRAHDWSPLEPKWRKIISVDELPWIGDHVVSGSIIYPASGMLVMAMEAAHQVSQSNRQISGYYIKEATFLNPIVLRASPEGGDCIETILALRPLHKLYEKHSSWSEIWISTHHQGLWTECFRATIQTQYVEPPSQVDGGAEQQLAKIAAVGVYKQALAACEVSIQSDAFYQYCKDRGIEYGDSFKILENIKWDGGDVAIGEIDVSNSTKDFAGVAHPAVIDAACQMFYTSPSKGLQLALPTEVPHRVYDAYVWAIGWKYPHTSRIRIHTTSRCKEVGRGVEGSLLALADDGTLLCKARKMEMDPIADDTYTETFEKSLLYGIEWKPCLSELRSVELGQVCEISLFDDGNSSLEAYHQKLEYALRCSIHLNLPKILDRDLHSAKPHMQDFIRWMERENASAPLDLEYNQQSLDELLSELEMENHPWRMYPLVARNLTPIIQGAVDPLTLLFSEPLAEDFYDDMFTNLCDTKAFHTYIDLASHELPELKILEVGAGTGAFTAHILSALQHGEERTGRSAFSKYLFTDISHGFFESAQTRFQKFGNRVSFKVLDLERDLLSQGIESEAYDLVVAGSVLHATSNLTDTLRNVRKAVKPGGKFVFLELTKPDAVALNFGFGILPGWWGRTEPWRSHSQGVQVDKWDSLLHDSGFSGNELVLRDYESDICHNFSIIASTAIVEPPVNIEQSRVFLVVNEATTEQRSLAEQISQSLSTQSYSSTILPWDQLRSSSIDSKDIMLFLHEVNQSTLNTLSEHDFVRLKDIVHNLKNILWVTSASPSYNTYPYSGMAKGFLRTIRSENTTKRIVTLAFEENKLDATFHADLIHRVFTKSFERESLEVEYIVRNGTLLIGRLIEERSVNDSVLSATQPRQKPEPLGHGPPVKFNVRNRGTLDTLEFIEDEYAKLEDELGDYELIVESKVLAVNFRDIFIALGRLEENEIGFDGAGIVHRTGAKCTVKVGDRVIIAKVGCMRTFVRLQELEVIGIPDSMSFVDAAAITAPGVTAYHSIVDLARLKKGERILIHSASGATGQLAVQISQWIGAEIFITVGTDEKKEFMVEKYRIPSDHIFYSRNTSFGQGVMRMTKDKGVHVVLNSLSGDALRTSWELLSPYGRFIEIGKVDISGNSSLPMSGFAKNTSFMAVDLLDISKTRKDITHELLQNMMRLHQAGVINCPSPVRVYPVSQIQDAYRLFQSGKNFGRLVINFGSTDVIPKRIIRKPSWSFDPNASYLIAGGLGGIGRAISRWMMLKGVKHIILPSRFGTGSQAARELVSDLKQNGVNVLALECDISSTKSLSALLADCAEKMPPVKGCINATMVLQDSIFEHMTHAQWTTTLRSKVDTSWNLHTHLPDNLDFFILLSSLSGIYGNVSQSNYAAGNTFKDSLARYRTSRGQKAISFNLGWMRTIGIIAETAEYEKIRESSGDLAKIEAEELLALLDIYCNPDQPALDPEKSQLLVGVVTPADCQRQGVEVPEVMRKPLFLGFSQVDTGERGTENGDVVDSATLFKHAETEDQKAQVVIGALTTKLARALSMPHDDIDTLKPLVEYGVDSLVAVELRNWIAKDFAADVAVFDIMGGSTITAIANLTAKKSKVGSKQQAVSSD